MKKSRTVELVVKAGLCTGCGTCAGLCPRDALDMVIDPHRGVYLPRLNRDSCDECGLCYEVCPGHAVDFRRLNLDIYGKEPEDILLGNYRNFYIGHAVDEGIRYDASSGGLVTALLIFALEEGLISGALVTRMKRDRPLEPEPFIARTREEIISAARSKYCPVPANIALKEIIESKDGERFAVVGLPCHIHGIRKAGAVNKRLQERIAWHFGLLCNHTPSLLATEYLLRLAKVKREDVAELRYRGEGWPGKMKIALKNGEEVFLTNYWGNGFGYCFRPGRCQLCPDHGNELADISFGDPWGIEGDGSAGKTMAISRSEMGEDLLRRAAKEAVELHGIEVDRVRDAGFRGSIRVGLSLNKALGKAVPLYNREMPAPGLRGYVNTILGYIQAGLGSNRFLWPLLPRLISLARLLVVKSVK